MRKKWEREAILSSAIPEEDDPYGRWWRGKQQKKPVNPSVVP